MNAPKPNTKFLKNIIQETHTHNAKLKVKELGDAARKLRGMHKDVANDRRAEHRLEREDSDNNYYSRRRRMKDHDNRSRGHRRSRSPRREERGKDRGKRRTRRESSEDSDSQELEDRRKRRRHERKRHGTRSRERRCSYSRSLSPKRHGQQDPKDIPRRHRHRRSPTLDIDMAFTQVRRRQSSRKDLPTRPEARTGEGTSPSRYRSSRARSHSTNSHKNTTSGEESDPLEAIIGPIPAPSAPTVQLRGRGALAASSGIDTRFSRAYDPATDVKLNEDLDDDWDQALEALKSRQLLNQRERLRAAGFTNEELERWERGGEKREEDVTWRKKGEGREWDRGKVVGGDGHIVLEPPEWGRLKGT